MKAFLSTCLMVLLALAYAPLANAQEEMPTAAPEAVTGDDMMGMPGSGPRGPRPAQMGQPGGDNAMGEKMMPPRGDKPEIPEAIREELKAFHEQVKPLHEQIKTLREGLSPEAQAFMQKHKKHKGNMQQDQGMSEGRKKMMEKRMDANGMPEAPAPAAQ